MKAGHVIPTGTHTAVVNPSSRDDMMLYIPAAHCQHDRAGEAVFFTHESIRVHNERLHVNEQSGQSSGSEQNKTKLSSNDLFDAF